MFRALRLDGNKTKRRKPCSLHGLKPSKTRDFEGLVCTPPQRNHTSAVCLSVDKFHSSENDKRQKSSKKKQHHNFLKILKGTVVKYNKSA